MMWNHIVRLDVEEGKSIRVLPITDRHNRDKDFDTVGGFRKVSHKIGQDIVNFIRNDIHEVVAAHLGDGADQGFRSVHSFYEHYCIERRIYNACKGRNFAAVGNHMYIQRDSNPDFLLLQPDNRFPTKRKLNVEEEDRIYHIVDGIIIGDVQISFIHYQEENKMYKRVRQPGIKFHIGLYHDDNVIPSSIKQGRGMKTTISSEYLTDVLEDIDLAVVAHWHEAIGKVDINIGNRIIPMYIPGALCHTSTTMSERHKSVALPTFVFDERGMHVELVEFKTYLNELKFYESNESEFSKKMKEEAKKNNNIDIRELNQVKASSFDIIDFIRTGSLGGAGIKLYEEARRGRLTVNKAIDITKEVLDVR